MTATLASTDVVVATHDRPTQVRALLCDLAGSTRSRIDRVIVVDDSARSPITPADVPELRLEVVRLDHRIFIAEARNIGIARANGEFVAVIDDDNRVDASTFAHPLDYMVAHRSVAALMPSVLYARRPDLVWVYGTPFRRDRWGFDFLGRNRPRDPQLEGRLLPTDALPNAALFRRDALEAAGGYETRMPVSSTADLCQRLKAAGGEVWADSHAFTRHDVDLPGTLAAWGQHATDPARTALDLHDRCLFYRRVHQDERAVRARTLFHMAPSVGTLFLSFTVRPDAPLLPLIAALARGMRTGLEEPIGPVRYSPSG